MLALSEVFDGVRENLLWKRKKIVQEPPSPGGGGELPYMGYIGMYRGIGYGFFGSRSCSDPKIGYSNSRSAKINDQLNEKKMVC